jgi:hypothetical protein
MKPTTPDRAPASTADRYRAAAKHLTRAVEAMRQAHAELTTEDGDELPFAGRVGEAIEDVHNAATRLTEYAAHGW